MKFQDLFDTDIHFSLKKYRGGNSNEYLQLMFLYPRKMEF